MEKLTPVEIEQNLRKESAQKEEAWKNCGKTEGLEIWRIENLKVVPWQKEEYGTFFLIVSASSSVKSSGNACQPFS